MSLFRKMRTSIILSIIVLPLCTVTIASATVSMAPATLSGHTVSKTVNQPHEGNGGWAAGSVTCDADHPYLVLDDSADNASRFFRHVTFTTGDNQPLREFETVIPEDASLGPNFTRAQLHVRLEDGRWSTEIGHKSITVYCADTLETAHQK